MVRRQNTITPSVWESFRMLREFKNNTLEMHERIFNRHGDFCSMSLLGNSLAFAYHPDFIQNILKMNSKNFTKSASADELGTLLGTGLLTSDGDQWFQMRKIHAPEFHEKKIEARFDVISKNILKTTNLLRQNLDYFDVVPLMSKLTFDIIAESFFGVNSEAYYKSIAEIEVPILKNIHDRMYNLFKLPLWVPSSKNLTFKKNIKRYDKLVYQIIADKALSAGQHEDVLARLTSAQSEGCPFFNIRGIRDQISTILSAGHETNASSLSWALYLLAKYPTIQNEMREELNANVSGVTPTLNEVKTLDYSQCVLSETLRLYPPVAVMDRMSIEESEIKGQIVPKNCLVEISPWITHRHPKFWSNPLEFRPRRFETSEILNHHPFAYLPFGGGPRKCIGAGFAILEGITALATLIKNFKFELDQKREVRPSVMVSLRPIPGIFVKATPL